MIKSLIEQLKRYLQLDKKFASKLNIFTLDSPDKATQKLLEQSKIEQYNRYAELYLFCTTIMLILIIVNTANGLANSPFLLVCNVIQVTMGTIWVICKFKAPNSKFYCYFNVIQYNFTAIWLNLILRHLIPDTFAVWDPVGYRSFLDYNNFILIICATLMCHDFKVNALVLFPSFLIQTYFLTQVEINIITELHQEAWETDAQRDGYVMLKMQRAFFVGLVIICSNYSNQRESSQVLIEKAAVERLQKSLKGLLESSDEGSIVYSVE